MKRLGQLFVMTLCIAGSSGCALVSFNACARWDLTPYFNADVSLVGGLPCRVVIGKAVPR